MDINKEIQKIWPEKLHCYTEEKVSRYSFDGETKEYLLNIGVPIRGNGEALGRIYFNEQLNDHILNGKPTVCFGKLGEADDMLFLIDSTTNEIYYTQININFSEKCNKNIACFVYCTILLFFSFEQSKLNPREHKKNYARYKETFDHLRSIDETVAVKDSYWCTVYMEILENTMATEEFDDSMDKALAEGRFSDYSDGLYQILLGGMDVLYKTPPEAKDSWTLEEQD